MILFGLLLLPGAPARAGEAAGLMARCFCVQAVPGRMPPYHIARYDPPPPGCENVKYRAGGGTPAENGLLACGGPKELSAGKGPGGGPDYRKVYAFSAKGDGEGLKRYLAPYFEAGDKPDAALVFGARGGYRSLGSPKKKSRTAATILFSKNVAGKMLFGESFGLGDENMEWFRTTAAGSAEGAGFGGAKYTARELVSFIKLPGGSYEIFMRRSGKAIVTKQISRYEDGVTTDYGFYYLDLTAEYNAGRDQTLNLKKQMSPSFMTYSLPSERISPFSFRTFSSLYFMMSSKA